MIKSLTCILPPILFLNRRKREDDGFIDLNPKQAIKQQDSSSENLSSVMPRDVPGWTEQKSLRPGKCDIETAKTKGPWSPCNLPGHKKPSSFSKSSFLEQLRPIILWVGISEVLIGSILVYFVMNYAVELDSMYEMQDTKSISLCSFCGLITLAVSGMVLTVSILLNKRILMWFYVLVSTFLCIYIFIQSIVMIYYSVRIQNRVSVTLKGDQNIFFSKPFLVGVITLLGSVIHFVGTVSVFSYYDLKNLRPATCDSPIS